MTDELNGGNMLIKNLWPFAYLFGPTQSYLSIDPQLYRNIQSTPSTRRPPRRIPKTQNGHGRFFKRPSLPPFLMKDEFRGQ